MGYLSPPPMPAPVTVYKDVGGLVTDYQAATEQYRRENREVRLHECRSACTLALSLPNVCVYPDAQVKFHQAYNAITKEVDLGVTNELWSSYPGAVRARLGYLTRQYRVLSGPELMALGVRNCNGGDKDGVMIARRQERREEAQRLAQAPIGPAPQTRLARAQNNARAGSAPLSGFGDLAQRVQMAVAGAFTSAPERPTAPIRVAVADRTPLVTPQRMPVLETAIAIPLPPRRPVSFDAALEGEDVAPPPAITADIPLPPRRPPAEAFVATGEAKEAANSAPFAEDETPLINGARPIVEGGLAPPVAGEKTPAIMAKVTVRRGAH